MSKLILSASLLLILEISSAQLANDRNKNIIAPYRVCLVGLICKDSVTKEELINAGGIQSSNGSFPIVRFSISETGTYIGGGYWEAHNETGIFSENILSALRRLQPGTRVFINNIRAKNSIGEVIELKPKVFTIISK
jgi:hypothetical protein